MFQMMSGKSILFEVYGDESVSNNAVVYAVIVVPVDVLKNAEQVVAKIKERFGASPCTELHCSKLFNHEARKRSPWAHLSSDQAYALAEDFATALARLRLGFRIGFVDKSQAPKELPEEGPFKAMRLDSKHLIGFAFQGAVGPLDERPGFDKIRLWVDPDQTRIPWFGKRRRSDRNYQMYSDISGLPEPRFIKPEPIVGQKPIMLQSADLLAYVSSHALSREARRDKQRFIALYNTLRPKKMNFAFSQ